MPCAALRNAKKMRNNTTRESHDFLAVSTLFLAQRGAFRNSLLLLMSQINLKSLCLIGERMEK